MTRIACDSAGHAHRVAATLRNAGMEVVRHDFDGTCFPVTTPSPRDDVREELAECKILNGTILSESSGAV